MGIHRSGLRARVGILVAIGAIVFTTTGVAPALGASPAGDIDPSLIHVESGLRGGLTIFGSGRYLTDASTKAPAAIVLDYVRDHHDAFGLSAADAGGLYVERSQVTPHDGVGHVVIGQRIDGIRVHTALLVGTVDPAGRLVMVGGRAVSGDTSGHVALTAGDAIQVSAEEAGVPAAEAPTGSATRANGKHSYANPYADGLPDAEPVSAELVWFITDDGLRLSWLTDVEAGSSAWFGTVVDAQTGEILERDDRYAHVGPEGRVFTTQHPDAPGATATIVPFTGWVTAGGNTTSGNNVNAYRDLDDNDLNDEYQPISAAQEFNYTFTDAWRGLPDGTNLNAIPAGTVTTALNADIDPVITQLFYYTNDLHDWLLGFGFDEASGNFQVTNPSGNGIAGDAVQAEAQDGFNNGCTDNAMPPNPIRCLNNANFGTNGDGTVARMQMFMWARPNQPYRDGSMDGDVIAHEYGHGVSNRLVPGTLSSATDQAGSLGEGWSDTISFLRWGDATIAEYVTADTTGGLRTSNYDIHPDTYGDYSTAVTSPHRNGEIWAATMYGIRTRLGIPLTTQLVLDGMRSTANGPSPTFLDARNGILANDQAANGGANRCALWAAFAVRGMGVSAVSNGLHAVPTEAFDAPADCLPVADAGGPYSTPEGTDVTVTAAGSTKGTHTSAGAPTSYAWDFDNDGQYDDATGVSPSFTAVGQDGVFPIAVQVTDAWGLTDTDTATVTVTNVAPTVTIDLIPEVDENEATTISGTISDPGWLDSLTATIDYDDGTGPHPLSGTLENVRPNATLTFSVQKTYGDNGTFVVTITGTDDDTTSSADSDAIVDNVDPTITIDTGDEQVYDGVSAFVVEAGEDLTVPADSTDPGSDDITIEWDWDDGTTTDETSLVNDPLTDPPHSPSIQPRDITLSATHAYADACVYDLSVTATDDDGGSNVDTAVVVITGNATVSKGQGWWKNQYRVKGSNDFTPAELDCYLQIVRYFSLVFDGTYPADRAGAEKILQSPAKSPAFIIFDQFAIAAWLNFANGSVSLGTPVDSDGNGSLDSTFGAVMLHAEQVRINPASTSNQIKAQKDIVERISLVSGN